MTISLEIDIEDLIGVNCLFKIRGDLVEGRIAQIVDDYINVAVNNKNEWYESVDVNVVKILFRNQ